MKYKVIDLFCGAGGLSLGFENVGFEICHAIDFNKYAIQTYNKNLKYPCGRVMDLTSIPESFFEELPEIDGIIGGPPCQGFSTAGQRKPDDIRNKLYEEYFKILDKVNPKFFVIENVVGILTYANGEIKNDIIKRAEDLGYKVYYEILNAVDYGVPQYRRRVIFVGIKANLIDGGKEYEFPKKSVENELTIEMAISDLTEFIPENQPEQVEYAKVAQNEFQKTMRQGATVVYNHNYTNHSSKTIETIKRVPEGGSIKDLPIEERGGRKYLALLRKMDRNKPALTIDTGHRTYFHYNEPRIPSVREVARLQSFPDAFVFYGPKAEQYKQVGNAVPPMLAEQIAKSIKSFMEK